MANGAVRTAMKIVKAFSLSPKGIKTIGVRMSKCYGLCMAPRQASAGSLLRTLVEWVMHASAQPEDLEVVITIMHNLRPSLSSSSLTELVVKYTDDLAKAMADREGFDSKNPLNGNYR